MPLGVVVTFRAQRALWLGDTDAATKWAKRVRASSPEAFHVPNATSRFIARMHRGVGAVIGRLFSSRSL